LGEVIRIQDDVATIQVFEETNGLGLHEPVRRTGSSLPTHSRSRHPLVVRANRRSRRDGLWR
jgi:vacuolar-type H+-ATPase subunit B/Vma2